MARPGPTEFAPPYEAYVRLVPEDDALAVLEALGPDPLVDLRAVPESEWRRHHPPYTWSACDVVAHLADSERVFAYRILRFARGDATPLPGFDENPYAAFASADRLPLIAWLDDFAAVRGATLSLVRNLPGKAWDRAGIASGMPITVRALAHIIVGHERHHATILRRRLGLG